MSSSIPLLIIAALHQEIPALRLPSHPFPRNNPLQPFQISTGFSRPVGILVCGVGGKRAVATLRQTLSTHRFDHALIVGWSGALSEEIGIFDLVLPHAIHHWKSNGHTPLHPDKKLHETIRTYFESISEPVHVSSGVTTDRMVSSSAHKKHLLEMFQSHSVDMETYYLMNVLSEHRIPAAVLRIISDKADETIGVDIESLPRTAIRRWIHYIRRPMELWHYVLLIRQLKSASRVLNHHLPNIIDLLITLPPVPKRDTLPDG